MDLAGDPLSLFFLGANQETVQTSEGLLRRLALGDVNARSYIAGKRAVLIESRHAHIEDPAVFSVLPPESILHIERFTAIECTGVRVQANPQVSRVHALC